MALIVITLMPNSYSMMLIMTKLIFVLLILAVAFTYLTFVQILLMHLPQPLMLFALRFSYSVGLNARPAAVLVI